MVLYKGPLYILSGDRHTAPVPTAVELCSCSQALTGIIAAVACQRLKVNRTPFEMNFQPRATAATSVEEPSIKQ